MLVDQCRLWSSHPCSHMRRRTSPLPARAATSPLRKRGQLGAATVPRWSADELSDLRRLAEKKKAGANTTWQAIAEELTRKHGSQRTAQGVMQHYWKKMQKEASTSKRASWIQRQQQTFGWPLLVCCCTVYFAQGFRSLAHMSTQLFLKDAGKLEPAAIQGLLSAAALPWSFKPAYGLVSDAFPIGGQHRRPYLVIAAIVGILAWSSLAVVAFSSATTLPIGVITALLWLSNFSTALSDVVVDAMVTSCFPTPSLSPLS